MEPESPSSRRLQPFLELLGLSGLAVAQPLLAVFGDAPDYFVFQGSSSRDIVVFAVVIVLAPPLVLWTLTQLIGWGSDRRRRIAQSSAVGLLVGLFALQIAVSADAALALALALAFAAGTGAALAHRHWSDVGLWASWLAPAPLVFLALFLFSSPVSGLVQGGDVDPADLGAFGSGDPPPVVMLVFDEWPLASIVRSDGTIDADLYPNVAALAG
ncbi:MAG: sulfatase, partial [Acidimicrobiales bacterium]